MTWIFGDSIVHNRKLKSILTHKLLFARYFTDLNVLKNIIGYIASVAKDVFFEVLYMNWYISFSYILCNLSKFHEPYASRHGHNAR